MNATHRAGVPARGDGGFTLIEVLVGMFIFAVMSLAALSVIVTTLHTVRLNDARAVAASLVARQVEAVRTLHASQIPDGLTTYTRTVGSTVFTIRQTAGYVTSGATSSACFSPSGQLSSKLVSVTATWPDMGRADVPRADTLVALDLAADTLDQTTQGTLALLVQDASGNAVPGQVVTLSPTGAAYTTGDDGCVVIPNLPAGGYAATLSTPGFVGTGSTQSTTVNSLGVIAGVVTKGTLSYSRSVSITISHNAPGTAAVPSGLAVHIGGSFMVDRTLPLCGASPLSACISAQPFGTASVLYPDAYTIWAGACLDPAASSQVSADARTTATQTAVVPLGAVTATVSWHGAPESGATVTVTRQSLDAAHPASCAGTETYSASTGATGSVQLALPYGKWLVTGPGGNTQTVSLTPSSTTASTTVLDTSH